MGFKKFIIILVLIILLWIGSALYFAYLDLFPEVSNIDLILKFPKYLWEFIKNWVMSL